MDLRKELGIRVAAPIIVVHGLMAGGANSHREPGRALGAGEHRGHPIGTFGPGIGRIENFGSRPQAVEDFAEEPFAAVSAAAFGEILRAHLARHGGDLGGFGYGSVVLPQPGHRRRIFGEPPVKGKRLATGINGQGSAASRVDPDADDLLRFEAAHSSFGDAERPGEGDLGAGDVVERMLPGKVRIARQNDPLPPVRIIPERGGYFAAIGCIDQQSAHGIRAVIESDDVFAAHADGKF